MEESRTSPRLIGISSPKTWDEWIKKEPQSQEAIIAQEELEEIVTVEKIEVEEPVITVQHQSLNTILEEEEDAKPSSNKTSTVRIKLGQEESPKVTIKSTRFQVIPTVDVWEPKSSEEGEEVVVGDPMTMIESHLNQLTMVESQLKKLKGGSEVLKMRPLKLDLDEAKPGSKSNKLGWLSIFKKKAATPPPQPTQPQQPQRKPVSRANTSRGGSRAGATIPKRHHTFAAQPPRIIVQVMIEPQFRL